MPCKTGLDMMRERGMDMDTKDGWDGNDFIKANLPMVVACYLCQMTMAFPSCHVDEDNRIFCTGCKES